MKSLLNKTLLFLLPILILALPLDIWISNNLKKSGEFIQGEFSVWNDIYNGNIREDLLIYGASRAIYLNPEVFCDSLGISSYNLGINGLNFWHIYYRHREYMKYNEKPDYILVSLDDFSLVKDKNLFSSEQFLPYLLGNKNSRKYLKDVNDFTLFDHYFPMVRYFGRRSSIKEAVKCGILQNIPDPLRNNGYLTNDFEWTDEFSIVSESLEYYEVNNSQSSIDLFSDFLDECREKDIRVIFVYTPVHIEGQLFVRNRDEAMQIYKDFARIYDLLFIDYSGDELCNSKEYFYNTQHLNKKGSDIFNKKLVTDLKNSGLFIKKTI